MKTLVFTGKASGLADISIPGEGALKAGEKIRLRDDDRADRWVESGNFEYASDDTDGASTEPAAPAQEQPAAPAEESTAAVDDPSTPAEDAGNTEGDS